MRLTRKRKKKNQFKSMVLKFDIAIISIIGVLFLFGTIIGSIILNTNESANLGDLTALWNNYLKSDENINFLENIFKYGRILFAIWFLGFFKYGFLGIPFLILLKGIGIGYTSSFIFKINSFYGFVLISKLTFIQSFLSILLCFIISLFALKYSLYKKYFNLSSYKKTYYSIFIVGFLGSLLISLFDLFI